MEQRGKSRTSTTNFYNTTTLEKVKPKSRTSLKGSEQDAVIAELRRQNESLRERVGYWRGQTRRSDRAAIDPKAVKKAAQDLAKADSDFYTLPTQKKNRLRATRSRSRINRYSLPILLLV